MIIKMTYKLGTHCIEGDRNEDHYEKIIEEILVSILEITREVTAQKLHISAHNVTKFSHIVAHLMNIW